MNGRVGIPGQRQPAMYVVKGRRESGQSEAELNAENDEFSFPNNKENTSWTRK